MRQIAAGHELESESGHIIDLGSFLMSLVTADHEVESETGLPFLCVRTY